MLLFLQELGRKLSGENSISLSNQGREWVLLSIKFRLDFQKCSFSIQKSGCYGNSLWVMDCSRVESLGTGWAAQGRRSWSNRLQLFKSAPALLMELHFCLGNQSNANKKYFGFWALSGGWLWNPGGLSLWAVAKSHFWLPAGKLHLNGRSITQKGYKHWSHLSPGLTRKPSLGQFRNAS